MSIKYPSFDRENLVETLHGIDVADPYRGLEQASEERTKWIAAQNKLTDNHLRNVKGRAFFRKRLQDLLHVDYIGKPRVYTNRILWYERTHDKNHYGLYTRTWPDGEKTLLLDADELSPDGSVAIHKTGTSRDGTHLAYGLTKNGSDWFEVHVMNIETGEKYDDFIPRLAYTGMKWLPDNSGFFYARSQGSDPEALTKTRQKIFFHRLGDDWRDDELVFGDFLTQEDHGPGVNSISKDGRHVVMYVQTGSSKIDLYYADWEEDRKFRKISPDAHAMFNSYIRGDVVYIETDYNAPRGKLCKVELDGTLPSFEKWKTIVREPQDGILNKTNVIGNRLFLEYNRNVMSELYEADLEGTIQRHIALPTLGSSGLPYGREEMDAVFLNFGSFFHPITCYRYDLETASLEEFSSNPVPFDVSNYMTEQLWVESTDGTSVPMFVLRSKDIALDGSSPAVLYGYGGFNYSLEPTFSHTIALWLELGGVYAVANLRGGSEFGEEWHTQGTREQKQNVFDDFFALAEGLQGKRPLRKTGELEGKILQFTDPSRLAISGRSNGGLLTGAALVQRPELFSAVYVGVPLLDMLRYHFTQGAKYWMDEYGDPDNPDDIGFLHAYSPYHNVPEGVDFPATLFETSLGDDRGVDPMHAMKMAALVQDQTTGNKPILLRVQEGTGHGHSKPVSMVVDEQVDLFSFLTRYTGFR